MPAQRVVIGTTTEFGVGRCRLVNAGRHEVGVTRLPNGRFVAVLNRCPHKGAPICKGSIGGTWLPSPPGTLTFGRDGEILVCPWHGREFDLTTGEEIYQKPPGRLRLFPVEVENDTVTLVI